MRVVSPWILSVGLALLASSSLAGEWREHSSLMSALGGKIKAKEAEIQKLMEERHGAHAPAEGGGHGGEKGAAKADADIYRAITLAYRDLEGLYKELDEQRYHVRFYHPEHGDETERKYTHFRIRTLEEMENEAGIDGKLNRMKQKLGEVYTIPPKKSERNPSSLTSAESEDVHRPNKSILKPTPTPQRIKLSL